MQFLTLAIFWTAVALAPGSLRDVSRTDRPTPPHGQVSDPREHSGHGDMLISREPMILSGYGQGGFPITTTSSKAQSFFDNGMQLAHAFAHQAAIAAFEEARRFDPACAMCIWGEAWASGPTINDTKDSGEIAAMASLARKAADLAAARGTARERDLIKALQLRYRDGGGERPGDLAFAQAMQRLVAVYPADKEIATIAADAWLIAPRFRGPGGMPNSFRAIALLEAVLKQDPNYSPAIHFYIHATEAARQPARAEAYADRLIALAPQASHLVHMPSHTWYWVGRYQDAADANTRAVALGIANAKRMGVSPPDGIWGLPYHEHNVTFGIGAALMAGDGKTALALGRPLIARAELAREASAARQLISAQGYFAISRFADPKEMLSLPQPRLPFLKGYWHYGRGEALARVGNVQGVLAEAVAISLPHRGSQDDGETKTPADMLTVARLVLLGRAAMLRREWPKAIEHFSKAATLEEKRTLEGSYDPPAWWYPVRRDLAEARLERGDVKIALREADAALALRPRDPVTVKLKARAIAELGKH